MRTMESACEKIDDGKLGEAASELKKGNALVFPTDTVWGLGVAVRHCASPRKLFDLKGRREDKPIAWLVGGIDDLLLYGSHVPDYAVALAEEFWPGPLTLVVDSSGSVPEAYRSTQDTIGLRMPDSKAVRRLIKACDSPLAVTSANLAGRPPLAASAHFDCVEMGLESVPVFHFRMRSESERPSQASTVVDCTGLEPRIIRAGESVDGIMAFIKHVSLA